LDFDKELVEYLLKIGVYPGSTCISCFVKRKKKKNLIEIICANVGDSRCVLCYQNKVIPMSFDHKPTNQKEKKRILNASGFIENNRINGTLAVSRAFGDSMFKQRYLFKYNPLAKIYQMLNNL
jgi:serine/threonine protein phosphatase PrpC